MVQLLPLPRTVPLAQQSTNIVGGVADDSVARPPFSDAVDDDDDVETEHLVGAVSALADLSPSGWNAPNWRDDKLSQSAGVLLGVPRGGQATPSALAEFSARLGDVVHSQVQQLAETTRIRLDPPSLGTLDVFIRYQAGHLTVSLSPSHAEVFQQLQASMAQLREQLVSRDYPQVQIRLEEPSTGAWQGGQQGQREQTREQAAPGRSLGGAGEQPFATALDAVPVELA